MAIFYICERVSSRSHEFHLNDQWTLLCEWYLTKVAHLRVNIQNHENMMTDEEIPISGYLSVTASNGLKLDGKEFAKFMKRPQRQKKGLVSLLVSEKASDILPYVKEFCCLRGNITITFDSHTCIRSKSLEQLSRDFETLLDPKTSLFADTNLVCGSDSIPAHKVILCARSPVFASMFTNPMKESRENEVCITDVDASVLRSMLIYMYTGKVSGLSIQSAVDLLVAADKYLIQDLKEVCCDFLKNSTLQDVLKILAGNHVLPECLKSFALDYIAKPCRDFSLVENTDEWKALKNGNPVLAVEILESFVKSKDKI